MRQSVCDRFGTEWRHADNNVQSFSDSTAVNCGKLLKITYVAVYKDRNS